MLIKGQLNTFSLLNKLSVSKMAQLSNLSKAYISQVKHGKRPPSQKLLGALAEHIRESKKPEKDHLRLFLQSREARGVSPKTLRFYRERLYKFIFKVNYVEASRQDIER